MYVLVALVPPAVVICFIKTCLHLKDLSVTAISQGTFTELVSLHLWPCGKLGKRIGLGVTIYKLLLFSFVLLWIIKDPEVGDVDDVLSWFEAPIQSRHHTIILVTEDTKKIVEEWAREATTRFQIASIGCLVIGWLSLPLVIGQVFYQDAFIGKLADSCLADVQEEREEGFEMKVEEEEMKAMEQKNEIEEDNEMREVENEVKDEHLFK